MSIQIVGKAMSEGFKKDEDRLWHALSQSEKHTGMVPTRRWTEKSLTQHMRAVFLIFRARMGIN